jgi:hypothetical protein
VVEEARLESVYTPKGYRRFESYSLRNFFLTFFCFYCIEEGRVFHKNNDYNAAIAQLVEH